MEKGKAKRWILLILSLAVAFSSFNVYGISDKDIYAEVNENEEETATVELSERLFTYICRRSNSYL